MSSQSTSDLVERIAQGKKHCQMLHSEGRQEELDQMVGIICDMEAKLKKLQRKSSSSRNDNNADSGHADPGAKKAYYDAREQAAAIKNKQRVGTNPLQWD